MPALGAAEAQRYVAVMCYAAKCEEICWWSFNASSTYQAGPSIAARQTGATSVRRVDTSNSRLLAIYSRRVPVAVPQTVKMTVPLASRTSRVLVTFNSSPPLLRLMSCVTLVVPAKLPSGLKRKNMNVAA